MGFFGIGKNMSASDFEQKLKTDPQLMLDVLKLFEGNPTADSIRAGVKNLGYNLEIEPLLKAFAAAIAFYKREFGDSFGGGSANSSGGGKGFMGFTQD